MTGIPAARIAATAPIKPTRCPTASSGSPKTFASRTNPASAASPRTSMPATPTARSNACARRRSGARVDRRRRRAPAARHPRGSPAGYAGYVDAARAARRDGRRCSPRSAASACCVPSARPARRRGHQRGVARRVRKRVDHPTRPRTTIRWYPGRPVMVLRQRLPAEPVQRRCRHRAARRDGCAVNLSDSGRGIARRRAGAAAGARNRVRDDRAQGAGVRVRRGAAAVAVAASRVVTRELLYTAITRARSWRDDRRWGRRAGKGDRLTHAQVFRACGAAPRRSFGNRPPVANDGRVRARTRFAYNDAVRVERAPVVDRPPPS